MQTPNPARIVTAGHDAIATALAELLRRWQGRPLLGGREEIDIGGEVQAIRDGYYAAVQRAEQAERELAEARADFAALCHALVGDTGASAMLTAATLRAERDRLRDALEAVDAWDLNWADGLDSNVERIKTMARDALRGEEG